MAQNIHPTAIVAETAVIGEGTSVGPYSIIGPKVRLGRNNIVGPHVVIEGNTTLGDENKIFQFASLGSAPQDLKYRGEDSTVVIGNRNSIREYVTIQPGTMGGGMTTVIGDENLLMVSAHVAHDCHVGNGNVIANGVALAGHVILGNGAILGGLSAIHQFVRIGNFAMIGGGSMVERDIPPGTIAQGDRARLYGINVIGLGRRGYSDESVRSLKRTFTDIFLGEGTFEERFERVSAGELKDPLVADFVSFVRASERGVAAARRSNDESSAS